MAKNRKTIHGLSSSEMPSNPTPEIWDGQDEEIDSSDGYTQYAIKQGSYVPAGFTTPALKAGAYTLDYVQGEILYTKQNLHTDELFIFEDDLSDKIMDEVIRFWSKAEIFGQYKFVHKRGFLLYGPQGSGKTSIVHQVTQHVIDNNGICFICESPELLEDGLKKFRQIEPSRPVVCVFEDIDEIIDSYGESSLLKLLDGESQINHVVNIATTNYPESLDKRVSARPRRFDTVLEIKMPVENIRRTFLMNKLNLTKSTKELDTWVKDTNGLSFAALAELVVGVKCLDLPYASVIKKLKDVEGTKKKITADNDSYGFNKTRD